MHVSTIAALTLTTLCAAVTPVQGADATPGALNAADLGASLRQSANVSFGPWGDAAPQPDTDNSVAGGCPIESPNARHLYMASNRDGSFVNESDENTLDIWRASRTFKWAPFGPAYNLGSPVNSEGDDFCPTPLPGGYLFFVSDRDDPGACGAADIYITRWLPRWGWLDPVNLGCVEDGGPNTAGVEFSPSLVLTREGVMLYFSSTTTEGAEDPHDIYVSTQNAEGEFGPGTPVAELNTGFDDRQPNVRANGLEVVFASNREGGEGALDIWSATRDRSSDPWGEPVNLGPGINTDEGESRPSLSWDGRRLHFGRSGEIYLVEREREWRWWELWR